MRHGLNIAWFASSLVSAYWNGAATYYRGIVRALHERGHRVTFFEPDAYGRQEHRDIPDPDWASVVVYPAKEEGVSHALGRARESDLIVKASGIGVFDDWLEQAVLDQQRPGTLVVFWDVDAPATLDRVRADPADPFRALIPRYDLVLTYGGGDPVVKAYEALGARTCVPIYNALDPSTHYPVAGDPRFEADLAFLGNRLPDREARVEEFFLQAASSLPERRFLMGGSGWDDKPMPANVRYVGHVYTGDHNAFNCSPQAVLNVSRESMARYGFSPATRVFEAAGAGACLITDAWEGIELFLEPGSEVLVARSGQEVAEHVRCLTPERARTLGGAACRRVLAEHTYSHRAAQFEQHLLSRPAFKVRSSEPRAGGRELGPRRADPVADAPRTVPSASGQERKHTDSTSPTPDSGFRIVILGLSITSSWGNGHATTYRGLVRELSARGHDVLFLERDVPWYASNRDLPNPPYGRTELYSSLGELKGRFQAEVRNADLVVVGSYVPEGVAVGEWVTACARNVTAFYDIDTPVTLAKLERGDTEYLASTLIPRYHLYLSFTGGPMLDRLERHYGSPMARALYCSVDPNLYYPTAAAERPRAYPRWDLGYLGTYSSDRQPTLDLLMLEPAHRWKESRMVIAGPLYPTALRWPSNIDRIQHLPPTQHRAFYTAQRFTLNITRTDMVRAGYSPSVRLFEAAACGTPIISDYWDGLGSLFKVGKEILIARCPDDTLRYLREMSEAERNAVAERALTRVLAGHTAAHRAAELEGYVLELLAKACP